MNKQTKTILGVAAFLVLLIAASFLYQNLSSRYSPLDKLQENTDKSNNITSNDTLEENPGDNDPNSQPSDTNTPEEEKILAPDFTVTDMDGNSVSLSDYIGKPIVLNFWASWCGPCQSEMPDFNKVSEEMGDDVTFLMVDLVDGKRETIKKGKAFIEKHGFTFNVLFDETQEAAYTYQISSIPTTYFIDSEGYIVNGYLGVVPESVLNKEIEAMLNEE